MIELKNIKRYYGRDDYKTKALNGISLTINEGEFVAIMGRSGCGKTTLLNILGALDSEYSGDFILDGEKVSGKKKSQLCYLRQQKIARIYQNYNLIEDLSVYNNIIMMSLITGKKPDDKRVEEIAELLGIDNKLEKAAGQISGGEKQRTAIARSLYQNADYILADEPTGNLDYENALQVMNIFTNIHNETDKTIVLVTHDKEMASYADRIINIEDGKIKES